MSVPKKKAAPDEIGGRVLDVVRKIPPGTVATYGQVAALVGRPRNSRQVGKILGGLRPKDKVPWHRVVNAQGKISERGEARGTESLQRRLLETEGIKFSKAGRIRMEDYAWDPPLAGFLGRVGSRGKVAG